MAKTAVLQIRINEEDKLQAEQFFESMGTSLSEAVRVYLRACTKRHYMPFALTRGRERGEGAAFGMLNLYATPSRMEAERDTWVDSLNMTAGKQETWGDDEPSPGVWEGTDEQREEAE